MDKQTEDVQQDTDTPIAEPVGKNEHAYLFNIESLNSDCEVLLHFTTYDYNKTESDYQRKELDPEEHQGKYVFFEPTSKELIEVFDEIPTKAYLRDRLNSIARAKRKREEQLSDLQEEVADKMEALVQQSVDYKKLRDEAVTNAKKNYYHDKLVKNNQKVASIFQGLASPEDVSLEDDVPDVEE